MTWFILRGIRLKNTERIGQGGNIMTQEFTEISVGGKFTLFQERYNSFTDGCYFEALEDNDGFIMTIYLAGMDQEEKTILESQKIHAKIVKDGNKILGLIRYGDSPLIFEMGFDPTLYKDKRAMQIAFDNHMLTIIGVERSNNIVQTLRMTNFPMRLKQAFITAWSSAYEEEDYTERYTKWLNYLYQYDTWTLWENATDVGYFGERGLLEWEK
jgi:hypothetical protein